MSSRPIELRKPPGPPAVPPRVMVTGLGALTALGPNVASTWTGLRRGQCGIRPVTLFDTSFTRTANGGQLRGFEPGAHFGSRESRRLSRTDMAGLIAAREALADSGFGGAGSPAAERTGVILGGGVGGLFETENYFRRVLGSGWSTPRADTTLSHFPCSTADLIARRFRLSGVRGTVVTACSSATLAIGQSYDAIRAGMADAVVTGGSDTFSRLTYSGFNALRSLDPDRCRPFDLNRKGLSLGEGAAILVLETLDLARARGARIHGELVGYGMSSDAHHMTAPHPRGEGAELAIRQALLTAGIGADEVGYINAHGTGTPHNDVAETAALKTVFGEAAHRIPVSSSKSMFGHCLGSAGAVEALATVLALLEGFLPPTANLETPDPACDLDYLPREGRSASVEFAISNSFAFGGNNGVLVFRRPDDH